MLLNSLLVIYASMILLNAILMMTLHFLHDRKGYYKTAAGVWVGFFALFAMDGFVSTHFNNVHHLFGIVFGNLSSYCLAKFSSDIYGLKLPLKKLLTISISLWFLALLMHFGFEMGFGLTATPICIGIASMNMVAAYNVLRLGPNLTIIDRLFAFILIAQGLHMLDYPFLRNQESAAIFGFSLGLAQVFLASTLIPIVINARISKDFNQILQKLVQEKTENLNVAQQQLFNSSKLAALGEMAGGVAHEINNPIATITLRARHIRVIAQKLEGNPDELRKNIENIDNFAEIILKTSHRIAEIVRGLKTFSRSGQSDPFQTESLSKIVDDTLALCAAKTEFLGINIQKNIDTSATISCRPVQISQVFLNIISNATYELSNANIQPKIIKIDVYRGGDDIVIEITDNGRGIPADVVSKIMQPFFTTKPVGDGTGLGLSISKGIVDSHSGTINIFSEPGRTCFKITFPAASNQLVAI